MTKFSIIVPIYKVEKYVSQCIESILAQTYEDFEILCVDDCGNDGSIKIVENFAQTDSRIKILYQDKNRGVAAARNLALENAQGEFLLCVDSDDWIEKNALQVLLNAFENTDAESVWFDGYRYYEDSKTYQECPIYNIGAGHIYITPENTAGYPDMCGMKAYRTNSIRKYGIHWPENIRFDEDGCFYFKYYSYFTKVYAINDCLYNYRIREGSTVSSFHANGFAAQDLFQVLLEIRDFYIQRGIYDEYKITLMKLAQNRIKMVQDSCLTKENLKIIQDFIETIDFPNDYDRYNEDKTPLVSVVVPFYNVENYVEQCLRSIMNQTYKNLEIICVDDCGQDKSASIVKEISKEDSRIKIIKHKKNKGLGGARTTGLNKAEGEYLLFIDSDDWIESDCVDTIVEIMNKTGVDSAWFKAKYWLEDLQKDADLEFCSYFMNLNEGYININETNLSSFPLVTWNKAYRRDFLLKNNLNWREKIIFEDVEFYFKAFTKTSPVYLIDKYFYHYRQHSESIMSKNINKPESTSVVFKILKDVYNYLKESELLRKYDTAFYKYVNEVFGMYKSTPEEKLNLLEVILK